ncbi:hypothetical protein [Sinomonas soli]
MVGIERVAQAEDICEDTDTRGEYRLISAQTVMSGSHQASRTPKPATWSTTTTTAIQLRRS